jgi:hypothetical protein
MRAMSDADYNVIAEENRDVVRFTTDLAANVFRGGIFSGARRSRL